MSSWQEDRSGADRDIVMVATRDLLEDVRKLEISSTYEDES
jgi:hypothetical protein